MQTLMQEIMRRPVRGVIYEDNSACITAIQKGYSPALRHLRRQHRVSISHLHETITYKPTEENVGEIEVVKAKSEDHKGDIFTKEMEVNKFLRAVSMLGMSEPDLDE